MPSPSLPIEPRSLRPQRAVTDSPWVRRLPAVTGALVAATSGLALLGWALGVPALTRVLSPLASMKANTAVCLLLLAVSLLTCRFGEPGSRPLAPSLLALAAGVIAALTLVQYTLGVDLGLDLLLFRGQALLEDATYPGRMSPGTAICLLLLSVALLTLERDLSDWMTLPAVALALVAFTGYLYAPLALGRPHSFTTMALHTSTSLILLSAGILARRVGSGFVGALTDPGRVGQLARRLLPLTIAVAVVAGWITLEEVHHGLFGSEVAVGLMSAVIIVSLTAVAQVTFRSLQSAEHELNSLDTRFRELFLGSPSGLFRIDPRGEIIEANPSTAAILGAQQAREVIGVDLLSRIGESQDRARWLLGLADQRSDHRASLKRLDGGSAWVHIETVPIRDVRGVLTHLEGSLVDLTRRHVEEERSNQAQRLEALGRLAGGVAHDFNNLLTIVHNSAELLQLESQGRFESEIRGLMHATRSGAALTQRLLSFSSGQAIEPRVIDVNELLESNRGLIVRLIGEDVTVHMSLDEEVGHVRIDAGQLEQVLLNLAINARDAMPGGGRLTIETRNTELDEAAVDGRPGLAPGRFVMVAVSDTGHGMDAHTREHAFDPFFTTKEESKGTGLGLSTVHGIVEQAGGHVWVYSEPGEGATFKLCLPRVDEPVDDPEPEVESPEPQGGTESILVVEDDPEVLSLTARILEDLGYRVLAARNPEEARRRLPPVEAGIDLLLTDVIMPGGSGRRLAEELQERWPGLAVLFMSGYADDAIVRHGVLASSIHFLQKPFTRRSLARSVRASLAAVPQDSLAS